MNDRGTADTTEMDTKEIVAEVAGAADELPPYLKAQLEDTLAMLSAYVRDRGLEHVFEFELWAFRRDAEEALAAQDAAKVKRIVDGRHDFIARVNALTGGRVNVADGFWPARRR